MVADSNASPKDQELLKRVQGIFKPLPRAEEMQKLRLFTEERVKLGHQLWYEPRLSKGDTVSCTSCHNLASTDVGDLPTGQGHKGQLGGRNSPGRSKRRLSGSVAESVRTIPELPLSAPLESQLNNK